MATVETATSAAGENVVSEEASFGDGILLLTRPEPGIALLTLNRPQTRNALSLAMLQAMRDAVAVIGATQDIRAVVLAANGPVFCAGHDLKELTAARSGEDNGRAFFENTMSRCSAMMMDIVKCPKPFIAAVDGMATAAGCQLVATADLAVASHESKFCTPGVNIGLFCSTPMVALSRNVSRKRAMEMLLLGELLPAKEAEDYGLINRAVDKEDVLTQALDMARRIAEKSSVTVAVGKSAFYSQLEKPLSGAYQEATDVMVHNMLVRDAEEGIGAFLEKRKPTWGDR